MSVTTVRLQPEIEESLQTMASSLQRSKSWLINQALKEFIERQSLELEQWQQTLEAMDSIVQGCVVSGESVHEWLNSWGTENELPAPTIKK